MTRISRIKYNARELNIFPGRNIIMLYNNMFRSVWRVTAEEQEYIESRLSDEKIELLTCEIRTFRRKRRALKLRNKLVAQFHKEPRGRVQVSKLSMTGSYSFNHNPIDFL